MDAPHGLHRSTPAELQQRLAAEERGVPFLTFRDRDGRQQIVELTATTSRLCFGRQATSDVALTWDDEVSRAHAEVERIGDVWTLVDDGRSRNGSYVNGERVHGRRALHDGDVLRIGRTSFGFVDRGPDDLASTAATVGHVAPPVTPAQRRVLVALCRPLADSRIAVPPSNRDLAAELFLSVDTVKVHLRALYEAFGLEGLPQHNKRATLAQMALERGAVASHELRERPQS